MSTPDTKKAKKLYQILTTSKIEAHYRHLDITALHVACRGDSWLQYGGLHVKIH